jgi:hypothetical protein
VDVSNAVILVVDPDVRVLVAGLRLIPVEGGLRNIRWAHPEESNEALLEFPVEDTGPSARLDRDLAVAPWRKG